MQRSIHLLPVLCICLLSLFNCNDLPLSTEINRKVPVLPTTNNPAIETIGLRKWYLTPSPITAEWSAFEVVIRTTQKVGAVTLWIDSIFIQEKKWEADSTITFSFDLATTPPGAHSFTIAETESDTGLYSKTFFVSAPYCITVSNDWDIPSDTLKFDRNLQLRDQLDTLHPALVMTHFVGPYAFTDQTISLPRESWFKSWLINTREQYGDEIGLHIHPYCNFLAVASIPCKVDSSWVSTKSIITSDSSGYSINLNRFTEDQTYKMIMCAESIFNFWELGKPLSFRAGGWTAGLHTLKALERAAFLVDASACNATRGEEFRNFYISDWLHSNWQSISDTSQPYYPSTSDINSATPPQLTILEAPDNGILADYIDSTEMVEVSNKLWNGAPLTTPRHFSIGYHPDTFDSYYSRLNGFLTYIDNYLINNDNGPVIYVTMQKLPQIW